MTEDSFFSIDRLVEFGMGLTMAQQMIKMMNESMQNMYIPGTMNPIQPSPSQVYYVIINDAQVGPLSESDMSRLILEHKITKDTYAWIPGMQNWQPIEQIPNILRLVAIAPPPFNK